MHPNIILNWPAIIVAVIAAFAFGFLWYGPLFGKPWAKAMGMKMDSKQSMKAMQKSLGLQTLGLFLMAYVLAHTGEVWRPSVWGVGDDMGSDATYGFFNGFFTWLGFFIPLQLNKISWEGRPWKVFLINTAHDFIILQVICQILSHWH